VFRKVLIANRGEIALRVVRACREMGIETVAVHSERDANALHVRFADQSVCIGPAPSRQSYLNVPSLLAAAEVTGADAIHPGYGFLSENPDFAEIVERSRLVFIGPRPSEMRLLGNKIAAREAMVRAGLEVLPGTAALTSAEDARQAAATIGFPVIFKAAAGGGGRGMRIVHELDAVADQFHVARAEAQAAFGSGEVYVEKYVTRPRHIEVQVLGDGEGRAIHLGERECSVQRRHQKLVEESPSPAVSADVRASLGERVARAVAALRYRGAGTVELLLDADTGRFFFLEMNTRIQVEHPVTEEVTGIDLVKAQLRIASGEPLWLAQRDITMRGHAIECRINAEDPVRFLPSPGRIAVWHVPGGPGVRIDSAAYAEWHVPPDYDALVAKVITHGSTRAEAIARMRRALGEMVVEGIQTNVAFHERLLTTAEFLAGEYDTRIVERMGRPRDAVGSGSV
jgi:acetyl-CoA carboxylase biotin carboxylase subunit